MKASKVNTNLLQSHSSEHEYLNGQKGEKNTSCCIKQELV